MNIKQLLLKLPDELTSELVDELYLPIVEGKEDQIKMTLIPYLKRHKKEEGDKLLDSIESKIRPYEVKRLVQIFELGNVVLDESPSFDIIRRNLEELPHIFNEINEEDLNVDVPQQDRPTPVPESEDVRTSALPIQPKKLIAVFRSMKYTLGEAVADLIDNSIDSKANLINVEYKIDEEQAARYLIVGDDGKGMNEEELEAGLTLGAERTYEDSDLGKFGIGLKLSSFSQAAEVTIFSQVEEEDDYTLRRLSYDHIVTTNRLELLHSVKKGGHVDAALALLPASGTVVLLEAMDKRHLNLRRQEVINSFRKEEAKLKHFLEMVFHRYIEGTTTSYNAGRQIKIFLNGDELEPLDPLVSSQTGGDDGTKIVEDWVPYDFDYERNPIHVRSQFCVLPSRENIDPGIKERIEHVTKSPKNQQGLYYYRNDRLIVFGGWRGVFKTSFDGILIEHASMGLAKVAIDVPLGMDDDFGLTPTKTDYDPPEEFLLKLSKKIHAQTFSWSINGESASFINFAKKRYESAKGSPRTTSSGSTRTRRAPTPLTSVDVEAYHNDSETAEPISTSKNDGVFRVTINKSHSLYKKLIEKLRESLDE